MNYFVMRIPLCAILAAGLLIAADKTADENSDLDQIQGTWSVVSVVSGGESLPKKIYQAIKVSIRGNKVVIKFKDKPVEGTVKLDPSKDPKEFAFKTGDQANLGLYELKGDVLKIGLPDTGIERPKDLTGDETSNCLLITLKRDQTPLSVAPNPVALGTLKAGVEVSRRVLVRGSKAFRILSVEVEGKDVTVNFPGNSALVHVVTVKCKPTAAGDIKRDIKVKTDLDNSASTTMVVEGQATQ